MPISNTKILLKCLIKDQKGLFLTLRRSSDSFSRPDKWDLPGGNLDKSDLEQNFLHSGKGDSQDILNLAITREIQEETGLKIDPSELAVLNVASGYIPEKDLFVIAVVYVYTTTVSLDITLSPEHTEFDWVTTKEFLDEFDVGDDGGLLKASVKKLDEKSIL